MLPPAGSEGGLDAGAGRTPLPSLRLTPRVAPGLRNPAAADALGDVQVGLGTVWPRAAAGPYRPPAPSPPPTHTLVCRPSTPALRPPTPPGGPVRQRGGPAGRAGRRHGRRRPRHPAGLRGAARIAGIRRRARRAPGPALPAARAVAAAAGEARPGEGGVLLLGWHRARAACTAACLLLAAPRLQSLLALDHLSFPTSLCVLRAGPCPACRRRGRRRTWGAAAPTTPRTSTPGRRPAGCTAPAASCSTCGASCGQVRVHIIPAVRYAPPTLHLRVCVVQRARQLGLA